MLKFIVHIEVQVCKNLIKPLDSALIYWQITFLINFEHTLALCVQSLLCYKKSEPLQREQH